MLGFQESDILVFGRSVGSGPACINFYIILFRNVVIVIIKGHLAAHKKPGLLLLMSPFKSIKDAAKV